MRNCGECVSWFFLGGGYGSISGLWLGGMDVGRVGAWDYSVHRYVRGIHSDGRFFGDLRFQSDDPSRRRACSIESALTELDRVTLAEKVQRLPFRDQLPSGAYSVIVEVDPDGQDGNVFAYNPGDELVSMDAATFVGIMETLRPYVESVWKRYW